MNNTKELQRQELHNAIWKIANDLRGAVDGWDFKQYVLGTLFYRYISENITAYINKGEWKAGNRSFDYAKMSDEEAEEAREDLVEEKGFFILPSELFCNVRAKAKNNPNLNETLEKAFNHIEDSAKGTGSEDDFKGLFDDYDVNSNKLGGTVEERNKRLLALLNGVGEMNLGDFQDNTIDAFGDAYEFLMTMYASNAGKSGGEFFTPQEVSRLLTLLALGDKKQVNKVYDPACGSGSLLLQAAKILGPENIKIGFFGQEINITTYNLCRINMFLHDINYNNFDIAYGDTLTNPLHWDDEPFDVIVSNPPYSINWEGDDNVTLINDERFSPAGVLAPKSKADFAFIMHSLSWLSSTGTASIVCFPGIFYRGGAEKKIRQYLVDNNFVDCIIQLPDNLFFGTSIATCIMVLKRNKKNNGILFIDASKKCVKVTNSNKMTEDNIQGVYKMFADRKDIQYVTKLASYEEIKENDYNLSVSTYVEQEDTREKIDIKTLNQQIREIVELSRDLSMAIAEYAPGCEVVAAGNLIRSRYIKKVVNKTWRAYDYALCQNCQTLNIDIHHEADELKSLHKCKQCGKEFEESLIKTFIVPEFGFISEPKIDKPSLIKPDRTYRSEATLVARGSETYNGEYKYGDLLVNVVSMEDGEIAVLNRSDFFVCPTCGFSLGEFEAGSFTNHCSKEHKMPSGYLCKNKDLIRYSLGYRFKTDALYIGLSEILSYEEAYSVLQAIILSACNLLNIDNSEIAGCLQYMFNGYVPSYDFIVYDTTPGGAGHVKRLITEDVMHKVLYGAYHKAKDCDCGGEEGDTSCYKCLRTYQNQQHHDEIKRRYVIEKLQMIEQ